MNNLKEKTSYSPKPIEHDFKRSMEKVEISKEEIINTLRIIESLKRKWLSYLKE